jgi:uncharacterized protein VirK/YbjX
MFGLPIGQIKRAITGTLRLPGNPVRGVSGGAAILWACATAVFRLRAWHRLGLDTRFAPMVERHPLLPALKDRPYLNAWWSSTEKMRVVKTHYELLTGAAKILAFPLDASVELVALYWIQEGLRLVLDKPPWFAQEGEVAVSLFQRDVRLYSLLFSLGIVADKRVAFVGALQGASSRATQSVEGGKQPLDIYKELTHVLHGMRPRDLLFSVFRKMCRALDVVTIMAVADRANVERSGYFLGGASMKAQHDQTWMEYGGHPSPDGAFFEIPTEHARRPLEDVPTRKRAQYRRRYAMLERIDEELQARLREPPIT